MKACGKTTNTSKRQRDNLKSTAIEATRGIQKVRS